jgi:hypothetical protein
MPESLEEVFMCDDIKQRLRLLSDSGVGIYATTMRAAARYIAELEQRIREQDVQLGIWREHWREQVNGEE